MKLSGLQFIVNTDPAPAHDLLKLTLQVLEGGIDSLQFRHKGIYTREIYLLAYQIAELCHHFSVLMLINDRVDMALAVHADGVHLGQSDLPIKEARRLLGSNKLIGCTASSLIQAKQAEVEGADYIGFGHIFPTATKFKQEPPVGLAKLKEVCQAVNIPILAIGGINEQNIGSVCATGVDGVALVSAISGSEEPFKQTQKFRNLMDLYVRSTS